MSAYVVVEATVRDPEARDRYGSQIGPVLKQFGGEILAFGPWQLLFCEPAYHNGMIIRFPDKEPAPGNIFRAVARCANRARPGCFVSQRMSLRSHARRR